MQSAHCQARVSNAVKQIEGAEIEKLEAGKLAVSLGSEDLEEKVKNAIVNAGYTIASTEESSTQTLRFKTNINCGGCVAAVRPLLDSAEGICHWAVDTTDKDKVLTVQSAGISNDQVIGTIEKAGFTIKSLNA